MNETEKIKFIGYDLEGNKTEKTISCISERTNILIDEPYDPQYELEECDYCFFKTKVKMDNTYPIIKVVIKKAIDDYEEEETIILNGVAYVMNQSGTTIDVIKSPK